MVTRDVSSGKGSLLNFQNEDSTPLKLKAVFLKSNNNKTK